MDLTAAPKDRKRDVSRGRLGSTALLLRELYLHIREDHPQTHLAPGVLALFRRE